MLPVSVVILKPLPWQLDLLAKIGSQGKGTIVVQFLEAGPSNRIAHPFNLNLCSQSKPLQLSPLREHKLSLSKLSRKWIPWIQASALERLTILALHRDAEHAWHTGYPVVSKSHNQPQVAIVPVAP